MEETQHVMHEHVYCVLIFKDFLNKKKKQQPNLKEKIRSLQHICINHSTCNGYAEKPIFHF